MNAQRILLAILLQFLLVAPAAAWSLFEDLDSKSEKAIDCGTFYQLPVQSDESSKEAEEEEEPDCE